MKKRICFSFIALLIFITLKAQSPSGLFKLQIKSSDKTPFTFETIKKYKATVLIFLLTDCPASQSYTLNCRQLLEKYSKNGINFKIVFPGDFSTEKEVQVFCHTYQITAPVLLDAHLELTNFLKATVAPECFLLSNSGNIIYQGRIDDLYYSPGRKRKIITSHDLDDAISNLLMGKIQKVSSTNAIGCIINY